MRTPFSIQNTKKIIKSPKKSQRGQKIRISPIQAISETLKIDFRTPLTLKGNDNEYKFLKEFNADLAVVVAYGQIIPKNFLTLK